jgi:UDP-GlcNAc:undecaprenyl-phosphate GlcNAc-1-phosphate transferase
VNLFLAFVVALSITAALIPFLARWAAAIGLTDVPGPRKVHAVPVPRVGGIAMAAGILIPAVLTLEWSPALSGLLTGLLVLLVFGVWDDRANLDYRVKFVGQILAVGLAMYVGDVCFEIYTIDGEPLLPTPVCTALTFVLLIGVTNAVNLSDGLDGLAGGMALLCFCALALLGATSDNMLVTAVALIEAGAILGFLRFNTHPARVFMGDGGSQVLGFTIGMLAILATQHGHTAVSATLPLLLIGVPVLDTAAVMIQRIRAGRSPFSSDRNHLHHKLLTLGFAHAEAVSIIYLLQVALFLLAYFLRFESDALILTVFGLFAALVLLSIHWALLNGWRAHNSVARSRWLGLTRRTARVLLDTRIPTWAMRIMSVSLIAYAVTVIALTDRVTGDVGLLCLAALLLLILLTASRAERSLKWLERTVLYVGVVLIVYLDQTAAAKPLILSGLSWTLLGITGVAALLRFSLSPARRFEVTSLDLLVVFIALVMPNLPGLVALPEDLPAGIAKAVILLYVVEMLLATDLNRPLPRAVLALMLGAIALRSLLAVV